MLVEGNVGTCSRQKRKFPVYVHPFKMDVTKVRLSNDCNSTSFWLIIIAQLSVLSEVSNTHLPE
jgi:hypothetical protein